MRVVPYLLMFLSLFFCTLFWVSIQPPFGDHAKIGLFLLGMTIMCGVAAIEVAYSAGSKK